MNRIIKKTPPPSKSWALASVSIQCELVTGLLVFTTHFRSFNAIQAWRTCENPNYVHRSKNHRDGTGVRKGFGSEWLLCLEKERMWDEEALGCEPMLTVTDRPSGSAREGAICPSKGLIHKQPAIVPAFSSQNLPIPTCIQINLHISSLLEHTDPCVVVWVDSSCLLEPTYYPDASNVFHCITTYIIPDLCQIRARLSGV